MLKSNGQNQMLTCVHALIGNIGHGENKPLYRKKYKYTVYNIFLNILVTCLTCQADPVASTVTDLAQEYSLGIVVNGT